MRSPIPPRRTRCGVGWSLGASAPTWASCWSSLCCCTRRCCLLPPPLPLWDCGPVDPVPDPGSAHILQGCGPAAAALPPPPSAFGSWTRSQASLCAAPAAHSWPFHPWACGRTAPSARETREFGGHVDNNSLWVLWDLNQIWSIILQWIANQSPGFWVWLSSLESQHLGQSMAHFMYIALDELFWILFHFGECALTSQQWHTVLLTITGTPFIFLAEFQQDLQKLIHSFILKCCLSFALSHETQVLSLSLFFFQ